MCASPPKPTSTSIVSFASSEINRLQLATACGVRSVCYLRWPAKLPAGHTVTQIGGAIDLLPTLTALAGVKRAGGAPDDLALVFQALDPQTYWDVASFQFSEDKDLLPQIKQDFANGGLLVSTTVADHYKLKRGDTLSLGGADTVTVALHTRTTTVFLGLLGTLWGVMEAFSSVSVQQTASLQTIAPGVSAALLTTIAGRYWVRRIALADALAR